MNLKLITSSFFLGLFLVCSACDGGSSSSKTSSSIEVSSHSSNIDINLVHNTVAYHITWDSNLSIYRITKNGVTIHQERVRSIQNHSANLNGAELVVKLNGRTLKFN